MRTIQLKFIRPPDSVNLWTHELLHRDDDVIVSKFKYDDMKGPYEIDGDVIVDNGYTGICHELLGKGLEVIKVLDMTGKLTGYYCNINRNAKMFDGGYEVVDLFLDVWVFPDLKYRVLDEDEFEEASEKGWISGVDREFALRVLDDIVREIESGNFPPRIVGEVG
jgi:predicted RNA-binding protein associated with RNAse of E/G family